MAVQPLSAHVAAGSPQRGQYYRHSGHLNPAGVAVAGLAGVVVAAVLCVPYAYADKYCPEIHLNGLVCAAYGAALGVVPALLLQRFKVRNLPVSLAVIALVAAVGLYGSWAAWEAILTRGGMANLRPLLTHPRDVAELAVDINSVGTWSIGSVGSTAGSSHPSNTSGVFLWVIWAVEAVTILGVPLLVGRSMLAGKPFCDACDRWCDGPVTVRTTAVPAEAADVRRRLEAGDFAYPATLGPATPAASLTFARHTCGGCDRLNTLTVTRRTVVRDRRGRARQAATKVLVAKLLVTPDDLKRLGTTPPASAAPAAASA